MAGLIIQRRVEPDALLLERLAIGVCSFDLRLKLTELGALTVELALRRVTLDALVRNKLGESRFPFVAPPGGKPRRPAKIVVFVVGGIT